MKMRPLFLITGLGSLACGGGVLCPSEIQQGDSCMPSGLVCPAEGNEDGCGLNGYECEDGSWREQMTYCNPPAPLPPEPPPPEPVCPTEIRSGEACSTEGQRCEDENHPSGCPQGHECTGGVWQELQVTCNPPMPLPPAPDPVCPTDIREGEECTSEGQRCMREGHERGCGLNGHQCKEGKWDRLMTFCNPPPPK